MKFQIAPIFFLENIFLPLSGILFCNSKLFLQALSSLTFCEKKIAKVTFLDFKLTIDNGRIELKLSE
jgi:hypothetical protein